MSDCAVRLRQCRECPYGKLFKTGIYKEQTKEDRERLKKYEDN